jgi:Ni,Fe-hydrogenase III large subunit
VTLPLGPFSTDLLQPLRLPLRVRGETVAGVETPEGGYCARGIATLAEGEPLGDVLPLIERSCALAGASHRLALCMAVEAAWGIRPARASRLVRVLFAEVERVQARLWMLALLARALGLAVPLREVLEQREVLFAALKQAAGSRAHPGVALPGGVRSDLDLDPLRAALDELAPSVATWRVVVSRGGPLGRLGSGIGVIAAEQVAELHLAGLAARGLGTPSQPDLRRADLYGGYADLTVEWPAASEDAGDVAARARVAVEDVATSLTIAQACFAALGAMPLEEPVEPPPLGQASAAAEATVEGAHGPMTVSCVLSSDMRVSELEILTPELDLFDALAGLLAGRPLAHLPAFIASLDLCMECVDR